MTQFFLALTILCLGGGLAVVFNSRPRVALFLGFGSTVAGAVLGLLPVIGVLRTAATLSFRQPWSVPYGEFFVEIDPLSAFFLLIILGFAVPVAIYGSEYLESYAGRKALGPAVLFFNLLIVAMAMVVVARNGMLFLVAWEIMSLASYFLVIFEGERPEVRDAGLIYLVAAHIGTAFLVTMFALSAHAAGSMSFDNFMQLASLSPTAIGVIFVLAVIGFGTKAGFMPLHVWLPEAHPAAPSHVSAVMSGVMLKVGIYGILRMLTYLGEPAAWWGISLLALGLLSGVFGILFALAQHDLKRFLAYSSVENIGIIAAGLGIGMLGRVAKQPAVAFVGFGGALFHILNHALFKGLLFFGAGSVLHVTHSRNMDRLGGLLKKMPWTGAFFLAGAVAICGLPPFNGFVSEWLIYMGMFRGSLALSGINNSLLFFSAAGLALIGALALAGFAKAFGIVFLGQPRTDDAAHGHEAGWRMRLAMGILALLCLLAGLFPMEFLTFIWPVVEGVSLTTMPTVFNFWQPLQYVSLVGFLLIAVALALVWLRSMLLRKREVTAGATWGCGFPQPTPRMQYTASSLGQPFLNLFRAILQTKRRLRAPHGYFPEHAEFATLTDDVAKRFLFLPLFAAVEKSIHLLRWLQHGRLQLYILYIFLTLLVLLLWKGVL